MGLDLSPTHPQRPRPELKPRVGHSPAAQAPWAEPVLGNNPDARHNPLPTRGANYLQMLRVCGSTFAPLGALALVKDGWAGGLSPRGTSVRWGQ